MNLKIDKALIKKYLAGRCDQEELKLVRDFLKQQNAQQLFDEVWNEQWSAKTSADNTDHHRQQMADWKRKIHQRIDGESLTSETIVAEITPIPFIKRITNWQYAAIWATLFIGAGLWVITSKRSSERLVIA